MKKQTLFPALAIIALFGCFSAKIAGQAAPPLRIGFYNVENLFDLEDDPATADEDFTPSGKQEWTAERYQTKLDHLGEVISGMGSPALLGLCEVENATVLKDLCRSANLSRAGYGFVHHDSPDFRGIDVALMYQKTKFEVLSSETIRIDFPPEYTPDIPGYTTRDLLVVQGILAKKDTLHLLVAHFPSRRGGLAASEPKRLFVAAQMRAKVDEIFQKNPRANIVIMGDFNDEPDNKSIIETLDAQPFSECCQASELYNCFAEKDAEGLGTYNYRGNWNLLDQVILSTSFFDKKSHLKFQSAHIYRQEKMMFTHDKYGPTPSRTYGGPNYYGGYSDHLPVYVEVTPN